MKKLLLVDRVPPEVLAPVQGVLTVTQPGPGPERFRRAEVLELLPGYDALFCTSGFTVDREAVERGGRLRVIGNFGVGYDRVDVDACTRRGVAVVNTPDSVTEPTAELTLALILAVSKSVPRYDRALRDSKKTQAPLFLDRDLLLTGKTVGILGYGRIGQAVGRKCQGLGMRVLYHNRHRLPPAREAELQAEYAGFDELVAAADVLTCHMPYTPENHGIIGRDVFRRMKPTAYFINAARGGIMDEAALAAALQSGEIRGAGVDVYENEPLVSGALAAQPNAVLTPHIGTCVLEARLNMAREALAGILAVLRGERPANLVNPELVFPAL